MGPKIEAVCRFIEAGGRFAAIGASKTLLRSCGVKLARSCTAAAWRQPASNITSWAPARPRWCRPADPVAARKRPRACPLGQPYWRSRGPSACVAGHAGWTPAPPPPVRRLRRRPGHRTGPAARNRALRPTRGRDRGSCCAALRGVSRSLEVEDGHADLLDREVEVVDGLRDAVDRLPAVGPRFVEDPERAVAGVDQRHRPVDDPPQYRRQGRGPSRRSTPHQGVGARLPKGRSRSDLGDVRPTPSRPRDHEHGYVGMREHSLAHRSERSWRLSQAASSDDDQVGVLALGHADDDIGRRSVLQDDRRRRRAPGTRLHASSTMATTSGRGR